MQPRMPQPGERWRIHIRPVEYDCPNCHTPLHIGGDANNGKVIQIVDPRRVPNGDTYEHRRRGCNATLPLPEGWIWFFDGAWFYTLPYTLFEPIGPNSA